MRYQHAAADRDAEIAQHPLLGDELVFRGGTCLHLLVLDQPLRDSEDLDYVRSTHSGIGPIIDAVREVASAVGLQVAGTDIRQQPKIRLRTASETDPAATMRIKVEINTHETSRSRPLQQTHGWVAPLWWTDGVGQADPSHLRLRRT